MPDAPTADVEPSTEAVIDSTRHLASANSKLRWGAYLVALSGIGFVVNGVAMLYRVLFSAGFEAGVHSLGGVTPAELAGTNPELLHYVDHLHVNVAGLMVAAGVAVVALALYGIRRGRRWAWATAIVAPAAFLAHSLPVHQTAGFTFDALAHLGPGLVWFPALVVGTILSHFGLRSVERTTATEEGHCG